MRIFAVSRRQTLFSYLCFSQGMVDPGEKFTETLKREFLEKAAVDVGNNDIRSKLEKFLSSGGIEVCTWIDEQWFSCWLDL